MDDLTRMLIEHACQRLTVEYCLHLDNQDAERFAGVFTVDARYKPAIEPAPIEGRDNIRQWAERYPKHRLGRHVASNQIVDVIDENTATGTSFAVSFRETNPKPGTISTAVTPRSLVNYFDDYRRTAEGWKIARRYYQFNFLREDEQPRPLPVVPW